MVLVRDLADLEAVEPNLREKSQVAFFRIAPGERVWKMNWGEQEHTRYEGALWIADHIQSRGLEREVSQILGGELDRLPENMRL